MDGLRCCVLVGCLTYIYCSGCNIDSACGWCQGGSFTGCLASGSSRDCVASNGTWTSYYNSCTPSLPYIISLVCVSGCWFVGLCFRTDWDIVWCVHCCVGPRPPGPSPTPTPTPSSCSAYSGGYQCDACVSASNNSSRSLQTCAWCSSQRTCGSLSDSNFISSCGGIYSLDDPSQMVTVQLFCMCYCLFVQLC